MNNRPLISAIIPTYNRADLVGDAIDSILAQTYPNVEIIVVDDGSTDNTQERLARYGDRIRMIYQENAGPSAARNKGIAAANGEFISFLDSDDLWLPTKLERQVKLLHEAGESAPCCLCNIMMQWQDRSIPSFEIAGLKPHNEVGFWLNPEEILATRFVLFNQGILIRRTALEAVGAFDQDLWLLEDSDLALRLSVYRPWTYIREPLVTWRETTTGSLYQEAQKREIKTKTPLIRILERHLARIGRRPGSDEASKYVTRELKRARRELRALTMTESKSWFEARLGRTLRIIEHYRRALYVRSPLFPRMKTSACSGAETRPTRVLRLGTA